MEIFVPDEIWIKIFFFLSDLHDLSSAVLVSKEWKRLVFDNCIWEDVYERIWGEKVVESKLPVRTLHIRRNKITNSWNSGKCSLVGILHGHKDKVLSVQVNSGLNKINSGSQDKSLKIWDPITKKCITTITGPQGGIECLQFDSNHIVAGTNHRDITVFDTSTTQKKFKLKLHKQGVFDLQLQNNILISASQDKTIKMWDLRTKACVKTYIGHRDTVCSLYYDGSVLFSGSCDSSIKQWDLRTSKTLKTLTHHRRAVSTIHYNAMDNTLVSGGEDQSIVFTDLTNNTITNKITDENYVVSMAVGKFGIVYNYHGCAKVRTAISGYKESWQLPYVEVEKCNPSITWITQLSMDHENRRLVGSSTAGPVYLWDFLMNK